MADPAGGAAVAPQKTPVLSIIGMILGILGLLGSFLFGTGILFAAAGVVLGFLGRSREPAARGLWLTALITGIIGVVICVIWYVLIGIGASQSTTTR